MRASESNDTARSGDAPAALAVVIVNYRTYDDLARCLRSLEQHLDVPAEIVVVDHESDPVQLAGIAEAFPLVRLLPSADNLGFAAGVNRGARSSQAPFLWLLNPDAVLDGPGAAAFLRWFDAHPRVGAAGTLVHDPSGPLQASARTFPGPSAVLAGRTSWLSRRLPGNWLSRRNLVTELRDGRARIVDWVAGSSVFVRRRAFDDVGGMDEGFFLFWEDADLCRRLKDAGWDTAYVPEVRVTHAGGRSTSYAVRRSVAAFHASAFRYYWKHAGLLGRLAAPLVYLVLQCRSLLRLASARLQRRAAAR
jgi:hypothetical protein